MRSIKYYINQALINVAIKCLEKVEFKSLTNKVMHQQRLTSVKKMRQCI